MRNVCKPGLLVGGISLLSHLPSHSRLAGIGVACIVVVYQGSSSLALAFYLHDVTLGMDYSPFLKPKLWS